MFKKNIQDDLNKAMKEKDDNSRSVLRMLLAAILNKEKELMRELKEEELIMVVSSEAKKRKEAIKEYEKGGRKDLVDKEAIELEILQKYLPEQLREEEIKLLVEKAIKKVNASEIKEIGKVMAVLMPDIKGKADGNEVNRIVKELLSNDRD
jgi:hypothetical protein